MVRITSAPVFADVVLELPIAAAEGNTHSLLLSCCRDERFRLLTETLPIDRYIDGEAGALPNAKRAVRIILNQNELDSLAAVRLSNPGAQIFYQTADDTALAPAPGSIFDPAFMRALVAFGEAKAAEGWLAFP